MPELIASLGHSFEVSQVNKTYNTDVFMNIIKRREFVEYHTSVPDFASNVAFVSSLEPTADRCLSIADRSTSLVANKVTETSPTEFTAKNVEVDSDKVIFTDIFVTPTGESKAIPLFWKHVLSTENVTRESSTSLTLHSNTKLLDVKILDIFRNELIIKDLFVDYDEGVVYCNLESEFTGTDNYAPYYVQYSVQHSSEVQTFLDLFDAETVYTLADIDDLDENLNIINDGRKVYLLYEVENGYEFVFPNADTKSYKATDSVRLYVERPVDREQYDSWHVRVKNGTFLTKVNSQLRRYRISEFLTQTFFPSYPYKWVDDAEVVPLSETLVKLDHENIHENADLSLHVQLRIEDGDGTELAVFTTDSTLDGTTSTKGTTIQYWSKYDQVGISSIDHRTGFVNIAGIEIRSEYKVFASYYYEETFYEYTSTDFNPTNNPTILSQRFVIFVIPDTLEVPADKSLYYLIVDETGRVIESDWSGFDNDTETYLSAELYYELKPSWKPAGGHNIFVDDLSVEGTGNYLILADMTVDRGLGLKDIWTTDTRLRGGGIREDKFEEALGIQPEVGWYWDKMWWDGVPYQGNASYMVEVPVDVLDGAGGTFDMKEVRDILNKHMAFGAYSVARAYGVEIDLDGVTPGNSVYLSWTGKGVRFSSRDIYYNVYYSGHPEGPWTLSNGSPIAHSSSGNSHTITGLTDGAIYYVLVVGGEVSGSTFVPLFNQPIKPIHEPAAAVGDSSQVPIKVREYEVRISDESTLSHSFEVV